MRNTWIVSAGATCVCVLGVVALVAQGSDQVFVMRQITPSTESVFALTNAGDDHALYMLNIRGVVSVMKPGGEVQQVGAARISNTPHSFAVDRQGRWYIGASQKLRAFEKGGRQLRAHAVPAPYALAAMSNGDLLVAAPTATAVLHAFGPFGERRQSFGTPRTLVQDAAENLFLNRGIVFEGMPDELFYVSANAPDPRVQVYTRSGALKREFAVEGVAIARQSEYARSFLNTRGTVIGGFTVITAATFAGGRQTIVLATTASPQGGSVYEYDQTGSKIGEYTLQRPDGKPLGFVQDVAVLGDECYVLSDGQVFSFSLPLRMARQFRQVSRAVAGILKLEPAMQLLGTTLREATAHAQGSCPPYQTNWSCSASCAVGGSRDCKTEMGNHVDLTKVINYSCTSNAYVNCQLSVTTCESGTQVPHGPLTLNCPRDNDSDGYSPDLDPPDCNDSDPMINPGVAIGQCDQTYLGDVNCNGIDDTSECQTPIVVDVLGNGFALTDRQHGVMFDVDGNGIASLVPWTRPGSDDAWLALDRNDNGRIDNGLELFGGTTYQPPSESPNGFVALGEFDRVEAGGNADGQLDRTDRVFDHLTLWTDANHNGVSEPAELVPVAAVGVQSISLDFRESRRRDQFGNVFRYRAPVRGLNSEIGQWACDVFLIAR
jgi:hypothetical protein